MLKDGQKTSQITENLGMGQRWPKMTQKQLKMEQSQSYLEGGGDFFFFKKGGFVPQPFALTGTLHTLIWAGVV